jgi:hypothetical protein
MAWDRDSCLNDLLTQFILVQYWGLNLGPHAWKQVIYNLSHSASHKRSFKDEIFFRVMYWKRCQKKGNGETGKGRKGGWTELAVVCSHWEAQVQERHIELGCIGRIWTLCPTPSHWPYSPYQVERYERQNDLPAGVTSAWPSTLLLKSIPHCVCTHNKLY